MYIVLCIPSTKMSTTDDTEVMDRTITTTTTTTTINTPSSAFKSKISDFWHRKYRQDLGKNWNLFYKRNETRFFRDRHWIPQATVERS